MTVRQSIGIVVGALALGLAVTAAPATAQVPTKRPGVWAQSYSGRKADPAIRFGQLANGMRYAVMHNATPANQMSLRLYIGSGSMAESDDQQGLAHFLEHLAFRGSTHVPDGEMMRVLQRHGLAFGADTNASTGQTATIYQFDFPRADQDSIDTGLGFFREIASELTLSQTSMDGERGVILSEERLRDSPAYHAIKAQYGFELEGQLAPSRWPIGKVDIIRTAQAPTVRAYYEAHYRPDNAVVVAVGDFDAAAMERQIRTRFAGWTPKTPVSPPLDLGAVRRRDEQVRAFAEPGSPEHTTVTWARPYDDRAETDARAHADFTRLVAITMLNQRFADIARRPDPPFLAASFAQDNVLKSANLTNLSLRAAPDRRLAALKVLTDEQRRALAFGFGQAELDRALAELSAFLQNAAAGADTRKSTDIVNNILSNIDDDGVVTSPVQDYADAQAWSRTITLADVNAALRAAFAGSGPLVFVAAQQAPVGGEAAIRTAYDAALADKVAAGSVAAAVAWPYASFGKPGVVVDRKDVAALGVTEVRFANGVRLTVKPTPFAKDEVQVAVAFGRGRLGLPLDRARSFWAVNGTTPVFVEGGTGKLSATAIQQALVGRSVSAALTIQDDAFLLRGRTRPADLATQMQLLAAHVADPGFRPEAFERMRPLIGQALAQYASTPLGVLQREAGTILHGGDRRWSVVPDPAALADSRPDDVRAMLAPALAGPLDVTIVGAVDVDAAIARTAETFGTLPARGLAGPASDEIRFPGGSATPLVFTDAGRPDQAAAVAAWGGPGYFGNEKDARALAVAAEILQTRVTDRLRTAEGTTYSPTVQAASSETLNGFGFLLGLVEVPPAKIATFHTELAEMIDDLSRHPVTADELARAKEPLVQSRRRNQQDNGYWTTALAEVQRDPRRLDAAASYVTGIEAVEAADIQRVVGSYLLPSRSIRVEIKASADAAKPSS